MKMLVSSLNCKENFGWPTKKVICAVNSCNNVVWLTCYARGFVPAIFALLGAKGGGLAEIWLAELLRTTAEPQYNSEHQHMAKFKGPQHLPSRWRRGKRTRSRVAMKQRIRIVEAEPAVERSGRNNQGGSGGHGAVQNKQY